MIYLLGLDDGFAMPTGVTVHSLDQFLGADDEIVLLHLGLSTSSTADLRSCVANAHLRFVDCTGEIDPSWVPPSWLSPAAFLRFLAADRLRDVDRCVYLDGDIVVRHDPRRLGETDLRGKTLGAVRSRVAPFLASPGGVRRWFELGLPSVGAYFNSGVLVMDLRRWREGDVTSHLSEFLRAHGHDTWVADQEAMNAVLSADWIELDRTWNYITHVSESFLQQPELEPSDPSIVHFAGRAKPWASGPLPLFAEDWYRVLETTPWRTYRPAEPSPPAGSHALLRRVARRPLAYVRSLLREA
jgi:lipopolysaccharide biosynthesis glycosyltransferase